MNGAVTAGRDHQIVALIGRRGGQFGGMSRPLGGENIQLAVTTPQRVDDVSLFAPSAATRT